MSSTTRSLGALSATISIAALACNFIASGITADNIQSALDKTHGAEASAQDIFTVGRVFLASAPVVLAVIVSGLVYRHGIREKWSGSGIWMGIAAVWVAAVLASGAFVNPASAAIADANVGQGTHSGPAPVVIGQLIGKWIFTAYGADLAFQGIAVGFVAVLAFLYYSEKWEKEDRAAAEAAAAAAAGAAE